MPLLDHFHPPLSIRRPWKGLHSAWANMMAFQLNRLIKTSRYTAIAEVQLGGSVEIDVATIDEGIGGDSFSSVLNGWRPSAPACTRTIDLTKVDVYEVRLYRDDGEFELVAAVELVSPRNKDRSESRLAFVNKCANYLLQGINLMVVDVVTDKHFNLHNDLLQRVGLVNEPEWGTAKSLYAVSYRSVPENAHTRLDWWPEILAVGQALPQLPLWLAHDRGVPLDLEASYLAACEGLNVPFPVVAKNGAVNPPA